MPILSDLIVSIIGQGKALGLIFYLFITTVIIFASFGMNNFMSDLNIPVDDDEAQEVNCNSMVSCFYYFFYHGARGNIQGVMSTPPPGAEHYVMRIVFDTVFFVWVGLVLFNIITGLMVESFSSARLNKQAREDQMATEVVKEPKMMSRKMWGGMWRRRIERGWGDCRCVSLVEMSVDENENEYSRPLHR